MTNFEADSHVLGSREGYSTLAVSNGVTLEERQQLESLRYGQTDDNNFLHSLSDLPSAIGRPLRSGRYAVTRCFMGQQDTAGRSTVKFVTLLFTQDDWVRVVSRSVPSLLSENEFWQEAQENEATVYGRLSPFRWTDDLRTKTLSLLTGFGNLGRREILGLDDSKLNNLCIQLLPDLLPASDKAALRWGNRVLSAGAGLQVSTYPSVADLSSRERLISMRQASSNPAPYAEALDQFWDQGNPPPRSFIDASPSINDFRYDGTTSEIPNTHQVESKSDGKSKAAYLSIAFISATLIVGYTIISLMGKQPVHTDESDTPIAESGPEMASLPSAQAPSTDPPIPQGSASSDTTEDPSDETQANDSDYPATDFKNSLTPNERTALELVTQFSDSGSWGVTRIQNWTDSASALFHVTEIPGYTESLRRAQGVLAWVTEAKERSAQVEKRLLQELNDHTLRKMTDEELIKALQQLKMTASEVRTLIDDPRTEGFSAVADQGLSLRAKEIVAKIELCEEIQEERSIAEEEKKRAALLAQIDNASPTVEDLKRVIAEAKEFAGLGLRPEGVMDWDRAPTVDTLEEWWSVLDINAITDIPRNLIGERWRAHNYFHRAILWRYKALRYHIEETSDADVRTQLLSKIKRLLALHSTTEPNVNSEELSGLSYEDFVKEMEQ